MKKAIFLDRDGTLNYDAGYTHQPKDLKLYDGVTEGLKKLQELGFFLIIITNQSGINRGIFTEKQMREFNDALLKKLGADIKITAIYFCPHRPDENCKCRKPKTALLEKAIQEFNIDPLQSYFVGDKNTDLECGENAGTKTFLITHKKGGTFQNLVDLIKP